MVYSQKNPIAFNEKPASSVKMNEEFVQIYGALNEIDGLKAPLESPALTGNPTAPTASKETDTTQLATTAFVKDVAADYAPLESPALTGSPTAPTQAADDDSTKLATTAYVKDQVASDTVAGMVELATSAETTAGTDAERAVTPAGFLSGFRGNLLGTVSQSDGIPTGAVIERGSNANGEYVKFADGTLLMVCSMTAYASYNGATGSNFILPVTVYSTAGSVATTVVNRTSGGLGARIVEISKTSVTTFNAKVMNISSTGALSAASDTTLGILVYGRWF